MKRTDGAVGSQYDSVARRFRESLADHPRAAFAAHSQLAALAFAAETCMCAPSATGPARPGNPKRAGGAPPFGRIASDRQEVKGTRACRFTSMFFWRARI